MNNMGGLIWDVWVQGYLVLVWKMSFPVTKKYLICVSFQNHPQRNFFQEPSPILGPSTAAYKQQFTVTEPFRLQQEISRTHKKYFEISALFCAFFKNSAQWRPLLLSRGLFLLISSPGLYAAPSLLLLLRHLGSSTQTLFVNTMTAETTVISTLIAVPLALSLAVVTTSSQVVVFYFPPPALFLLKR